MDTFSQKLLNDLTEFQKENIDFLRNHSSIIRKFYPNDIFFNTGGDYGFTPLHPNALPLQNKLFKAFNTLCEIINILLVDSIDEYNRSFESLSKRVLEHIQQNENTYLKNLDEVIIQTNLKIEDIKQLILKLWPESHTEPYIIPDTNAFYANIDIERWSFAEFDQFTIVLTPSILRDLDKHKIEHRNESVRNKAATLIRKIKEYRRRGKLTESVSIVHNKIKMFSIAMEPNFERTLSWLDKTNDDDRLIAETFEIIRKYIDHPIYLVTSDINLQNKCEIASLIYLEPPEDVKI